MADAVHPRVGYAEEVNRPALRFIGDAAFASALAAVAVAEVWLPLPSAQGQGSPLLSSVVAVTLCLALAFRRRWPLTTALVVLLTWPLAFTLQPILILFWGQLVPIVVATYSVARYAPSPGKYIGGIAAGACLVFFDLRVAELQDFGEVVFHWLAVGLAWAIGMAVQAADQRAKDSRRREIQIQAESSTRVHAALAEERARIARELHDIVAHAVSMMTVQAGAAEQVVTQNPEFTRQALASIRNTGSAALDEMRRLVVILREDDATPAQSGQHDADSPMRPQPGIADLPALIAQAQSGALGVHLSIEGAVEMLPTGLDLAAYRIVQEALTNVRKHADATSAYVKVRSDGVTLTIEVTDDGPGAGLPLARPEDIRGHGIIGMRERAAFYGGTLAASGVDGTGFTVFASLPIGSSPRSGEPARAIEEGT